MCTYSRVEFVPELRPSACPLSYWNLLVSPAMSPCCTVGPPPPSAALSCGSHITTITSPARAKSSFPQSEHELTMCVCVCVCVCSSPTDSCESQSELASKSVAFPSRFGQGCFESCLKRGSARRVTIALLWRQLPFMARLDRKRVYW
jgi:hypothetical protein